MDLEMLSDQIEIEQLCARYFMLSARKDNEHWREIFTEDGARVFPSPPVTRTDDDSIERATATRTLRSGPSSWSDSAASTHRPSTTSNDAPPKATRNETRSAASNASSHARSTSTSKPSPRHTHHDQHSTSQLDTKRRIQLKRSKVTPGYEIGFSRPVTEVAQPALRPHPRSRQTPRRRRAQPTLVTGTSRGIRWPRRRPPGTRGAR